MYVTWKLLQLRREHADFFCKGEYIPLQVTGTRANHVIAFARQLHGQWCIVAVPRLYASLTRAGTPPLGKKVWTDTQIELPAGAPRSWKNVLTGDEVSSPLFASDLLAKLPIGVCSGEV